MKKEIDSKKEWLINNIARHIRNFKREKEKNKKKAFYSNILVASIGLITTVLLGMSLMFVNPYLKISSIILAITITIISIVSVFFDFTNLWIRYTMTLNKLYEIRDDFNYYLSGKPEENILIEDIEKFKKRLNRILNETNNSWANLKR